MSRPSEPLLAWLRELLKSRGLNTANLAQTAGLERSRVRKILGGSEAMTVDELMQISDALDLDPNDLAQGQLPEPVEKEVPSAGPALASVVEEPPEDTGPEVDPFGNQPEQLFKVAFGLGCTFYFLTDTAQLDGSGVPKNVLDQYRGGQLPIKLEAAYHQYNEPRYSDEGITLTLSFDALYECFFPWSCVQQFVLFPDPPEPASDPTDEEPSEGVPHLRLVT